jgi:tRNA(fMet)-specific endonuclease VapC
MWMLDTNTVSHIIRGHEAALARLAAVSPGDVRVSVITEGELRFGLARRPHATRLNYVVLEFLRRVGIEEWTSSAAVTYGRLRADLERAGRIVGALDLLIAAHAITINHTLIANDGGFNKIESLKTEDWTK